ncbi:MAG: hypothetical protein ABR548_01635 [Actinomycetota bacterium]|nr:hypothetical protein [Actinomycetota bacterium]
MDIREVAKFTAGVALLAILSDAVIGHALAWENDPYWTYWVTKTFLIATVFGLGTAWFGVGARKGAAITAVHTVVLTVYYWSLSPIGLPSHASWLDLEHTWVSGVPIHFGVIYLGYLTALWAWRRRERVAMLTLDSAQPTTRVRGIEALIVGLLAVVVMGALEALAIGEFQGVTWYVVRLLIVVSFLLAWQALAGRDVRAALGGTVVLTAILTAYSHFLGPVGLPDLPIRVFERAAPGATAHWLTFRQEALIAMPITFLAALGAFLVLSRTEPDRAGPSSRGAISFAIGAIVVAAVGALIAPKVTPTSSNATVSASGSAQTENGQYFRGSLQPGSGTLALTAIDRNPRVTPLPPHDTLLVTASIDYADGHRYDISVTKPMVDDPLGRFGTWWGVGMDVWHHGRSGIGSPLIPPTHSEVAVFGLATVTRDGTLVAAGAPMHAMTMDDEKVELDVGDPSTPLPGLPDGHLRTIWPVARITTHHPNASLYLLGIVILMALFALAGAGLRAEPSARRER